MSEYSSPEDSSFEYIDISEFCRLGNEIKGELKSVSDETKESPFEADLLKDQPLTGVNQAMIAKWIEIFESHPDEQELPNIIATEDANLNGDSARKEAELARRIARSQLYAVKVHNEECVNAGGSSRVRGAVNPSLSNPTCQGSVIFEERPKEKGSEEDVIISVTILPGGRPSPMQMALKQEIEFKASGSLASLAREVYCVSKRLTKECFFKDGPLDNLLIMESSAFIFMENAFYDDPLEESSMTHPSDAYFEAFKAAGKYSGAAHVLSMNPERVKRGSLKETCWRDLKIRLNTPYLLIHLGGCEHIFYVTQVRHASKSDCLNLEFPHVSNAMRVRRRKCRICEVYAGNKIISNDKLMPENPCIICDKCFEGFHGKDKKWYSDFEVVPYYHDA